MSTLSLAMAEEYQRLYDTAQPRPERIEEVGALAVRIGQSIRRYQASVVGTRVPWQWIGIVHLMECALDFSKHLHNGDPLTARTKHSPAGRPFFGFPPFDWEASAKDAIIFKQLHTETRWDVPAMLFAFERYNGMGYRTRDIHSPYLWSGSAHYTKGKFSADGLWKPNAVSKQIGAGVVLRRLLQLAPIGARKEGAERSQSSRPGSRPIT